jgi:hypothetical protein
VQLRRERAAPGGELAVSERLYRGVVEAGVADRRPRRRRRDPHVEPLRRATTGWDQDEAARAATSSTP